MSHLPQHCCRVWSTAHSLHNISHRCTHVQTPACHGSSQRPQLTACRLCRRDYIDPSHVKDGGVTPDDTRKWKVLQELQVSMSSLLGAPTHLWALVKALHGGGCSPERQCQTLIVHCAEVPPKYAMSCRVQWLQSNEQSVRRHHSAAGTSHSCTACNIELSTLRGHASRSASHPCATPAGPQ